MTDNRLSITDEKAHYLLSVLRCRKGDHLIVFDGSGNCFRTSIIKAHRREVIAEIIEQFFCDHESHLHIILIQGILKGEKMDMIIQKTTELGVNEIVPAVTERSQLRDTRRVKRWRKIAEEASRQSGRSVVPVVHEPVELKKVLTSYASQSTPQGFIFYEEGGMKLSEAVKVFPTKGSKNPSCVAEVDRRKQGKVWQTGLVGGDDDAQLPIWSEQLSGHNRQSGGNGDRNVGG